ncbi:MAG: hypothetical protein KAI29_28770, partial [Cyclobacteriaceae bacterium]|nr:hypothetical protein [Cyclobacteriaceae bacterium]
KRLEEDTTSSSSLMGLISLAKYFFERRSEELAWGYLKSAEVKATSTEQFDLLNTIYLLQIEHWNTDFDEDIHAIIEKRSENKLLLDEDERATIARSLIKKELQKTALEGKEVDFEGINKLILSSYNLSNALIKRPKLLLNILSIARSTILAKKDFYSFEPYLIQQYNKAKEQFGFSRNNHFYKLNLVYMISHVLYRNRKFDLSAIYLEEMKDDLYAHNSSHIMLFYAKYVLLNAAVVCYQGNLQNAIVLLKEGIEDDTGRFSPEDKIKLQLNLSIYYFMAGELAKTIKTGMSFAHSDKWFEKNIGREWVFKKQIMEVIVQVELDNHEIALNRIRALERTSAGLFNHPLYSRAKSFLEIIKKMINDPLNFRNEDTQKKIEKYLVVVPEEKEDLQAMTFYAWLKAKFQNRNYYEVLLETVKPD